MTRDGARVKIYTRTGDGGETALFGGGRVDKHHLRVRAYGSVDELNSFLGWAITQLPDHDERSRLSLVQNDLFAVGAELATPPPSADRPRPDTPDLPLARIETMESWIDEAQAAVEPLREFVLPGGSPGAAALHVARTVCRRAEREVVALSREAEVHEGVSRYLNRLSDLLFALARRVNARAGVPDVTWDKEA
jgi:cob(I)alamin adenosyltransferase